MESALEIRGKSPLIGGGRVTPYHVPAEGVRFELTVGCPTSVFKTDALDLSATPPCPTVVAYNARSHPRMIQFGYTYAQSECGVALERV